MFPTSNKGGAAPGGRRNTAGGTRKNQGSANGGGANAPATDQKGARTNAGKGKKQQQSQQQQQQSYDMKYEDEAIISTSNTAVHKPAAAATNVGRRGAERALQKTTWLQGESNAMGTLEELGNSMGREFNQFEGKKTDYSDDLYSTKLNMSSVTQEQQARAMRVQRDITSTSTKNRHMAEERNQVELKSDGEGEEEGKYGATDRKAQTGARNQDGGVFTKSGNNAAGKSRKKNAAVNALAGKFKTFRAEFDKNAMTAMKAGFVTDLVNRKPTDLFFAASTFQPSTGAPVTSNSNTTTTSNLQQTKTSAGLVVGSTNFQPTATFTPQSQQPQKMVVSAPSFLPGSAQPFIPQAAMPAQPVAAQTSTSNPFAVASQNTLGSNIASTAMTTKTTEFMPSGQSNVSAPAFMPNQPVQAMPKVAQQSMPFKPQAKPFNSTNAQTFTPSQSFQPTFVQQQPPQQQQQQQQQQQPQFTQSYNNSGYQHQHSTQQQFQHHPQQQQHFRPQYPQHQQPQSQYGGGRPHYQQPQQHQQQHYNRQQQQQQQQQHMQYQQRQQGPPQNNFQMPMPNQQPQSNGNNGTDQTPNSGSNPFAKFADQNSTFEPANKTQ